ncbi:MAG: MBL fold metallo-hydrolase [Pyrinomonadaceae bacterium]
MKNGAVYLKRNLMVEPLVNQWYAWSYLIAPATAAMFIANSHLKIMQSFINAPQVHITALRNPAMRGGPFINYGADKVPSIKALTEKTIKEQSHMLELADAIKSLDQKLSSETSGFSLEPVYRLVPDILKGYVELLYDLNNHPSIRFIEGLLYKSKYRNQPAQSVSLSLTEMDDRPFVFGTPKLEDEKSLHLKIPFDSEALDTLFRMKRIPQPYEHIKEVLKIEAADDELLASFFTEEAPPESSPFTGEGVRIRYFGHACVLMESKETSVLCDPVISYEHDNGIPRYTYADLPEKLDYVLVTHNHQDHCMFETLLQLRYKIRHLIVPKNNGGALADPSLKLALQNIGFDNAHEIDEMETVKIAGGSITSLPFLGEHADLNIRTKTAYLVEMHGNSILCAADSNNVEPKLYEHIRETVGEVETVFLGMECDGAPLTWISGPLLTKPMVRKMDQSRRLNGSNYEKGIDIVDKLNPGKAYVYAMGQEPWLTYLTSIQYTEESVPIIESNKLVEECRRRGIVSERLFGHKEIFLAPR